MATAALLAAGALTGAEKSPPRPEITAPEDELAPEGHFKLTWSGAAEAPPETVFTVQQGRDPEFREPTTVYTGPDSGTYRSGLTEGDYFYRVRAERFGGKSPWSETKHVRVQYVGDQQVAIMMLAGFVVFVATVAFIVTGHLRTRHQTIHPEDHDGDSPHAG